MVHLHAARVRKVGRGSCGIVDGSTESCIVRKLASTADLKTLDDTVRLNRLAAEAIFHVARGNDGELATEDDGWSD